MTDPTPAVPEPRRWAVFRIDRGRPFRISHDFRSERQAEEFMATKPSDWQLEIRAVEAGA